MKKMLVLIAILALCATSAFALTPEQEAQKLANATTNVNVRFTVDSCVSLWNAGPATVDLHLLSLDGNNIARATGAISYLNNIPAVIKVEKQGVLANGLRFCIGLNKPADWAPFDTNDSGFAFWRNYPAGEEGATEQTILNVANDNYDAQTLNVSYYADGRDRLPDNITSSVVVKWTIVPATN